MIDVQEINELHRVQQEEMHSMGVISNPLHLVSVQSNAPSRAQSIQQGEIHIASVTSIVPRLMRVATGSVVPAGGLPPGGLQGDLLAKRTSADFDAEWITPANSPEADNTKPITAAAVYREIGNINALLATI